MALIPSSQFGVCLYGRRGREARLAFLRDHPLCAMCSTVERLVAATVVDHIRPHKGDLTLFWDRERCVRHYAPGLANSANLQSRARPRPRYHEDGTVSQDTEAPVSICPKLTGSIFSPI